MAFALDDSRPIYIQIAEQIVDAILSGAYPEESQIPSTTEFSAIFAISFSLWLNVTFGLVMV